MLRDIPPEPFSKRLTQFVSRFSSLLNEITFSAILLVFSKNAECVFRFVQNLCKIGVSNT